MYDVYENEYQWQNGLNTEFIAKNRNLLKEVTHNAINNNIISLDPFYLIKLNSPGDIQIYDSH